MKIFLKTLSLTVCLCASMAAAANETRPLPSPGGELAEQDENTWEGVVDYLRVPQSEIVVGDRMFIFSTNTVITKRGQKAPIPIGELKKGVRVRVIPILPVPEMATPRALQIEILQ